MALPPRLRQIAIFDRSTTAPGLGAISCSISGSIVLDSVQSPVRAGNFVDREYFIHQRDTPTSTASTSAGRSRPVFNKRSGASRSAGGSINRMATLTASFRHPQARFYKATIGVNCSRQNGVATLFRDDGVVLVQKRCWQSNIGADWSKATIFRHVQSAPAGTFESNGAMDHVPRLYAYRRSAACRCWYRSVLRATDVLAPWWFKIELLAAVFGAMAASVICWSRCSNRETAPAGSRAEKGQAALARHDSLSQLANRRGFDERSHWRGAGPHVTANPSRC